ncbi:MAG: hypothetical protein H0W34_06860 [Pyrinomonadaceae bacterium]|nr:hypothetical protein [Pyrinomonadaceae bacterium]
MHTTPSARTMFPLFLITAMAGCASSVAVERVKMGDAQLTCAQLLSEIQETDRFRKAAEENKDITGKNAAAILVLPVFLANYSDANEAIRAADERKAHLIKLHSEKHCEQSAQ